jgi:3-keto-disaccharide hydrolase
VNKKVPGGDIITRQMYENFELELEWMVSEKGNSGLFYNVIELDLYQRVSRTGPELQIVDDAHYSDTSSGDLCGLVRSQTQPSKPARQWNAARLVVNNGKAEHWINGVKVVEYSLWTKQWDALIDASKFNIMLEFGKARRGHIALQDHGTPVWYRNIRIREILR